MKRSCLFLICTMFLATIAVSAGASTSFFGPEGLVVMPTAEVLSQGQFQVYANYIDQGNHQETPIGVNVGLGHGIELGAASVHEEGVLEGTEIIINAKWVALQETAVRPSVAIGAINAAGNEGFAGSIIIIKEKGEVAPYVVAGKKLALPGSSLALTGHAGYIGGNFSSIMVGVGAKMAPNLDVMADWLPNYTDFSIGARYKATDSLSINANVIDGDFAIGTAYTFALK